MAKQAILDVLESTIGKYIKNLDSESVNVALWNGQIELNSLELNIGAVNAELDRQAAEAPNLAIPFRVSSGRFASLQVDVPWARISSRSVVFRARGLEIVLEACHRRQRQDDSLNNHPLGFQQQHQQQYERRIQQWKEERLQSIKLYDQYRKQANAIRKLTTSSSSTSGIDNPTSTPEQATFTARLVRRIIENLQIEIEDVHLVFRNRACSAGIKLQSLSLVTTDFFGKRTFVDRTVVHTATDTQKDSFLHKELEMKAFAIYLDEHTPFAVTTTIQEEDSQATPKHSYLLQPLSFRAKLRQSDSHNCVEFPKYRLTSELSRLSVQVLRSQLEQIHKISQSISPHNVPKPLFPEYRPIHHISPGTARLWWKYAFQSVRRLKGKRLWVEFFTAFQKRKDYISLYKRQTNASTANWMIPLSDQEQLRLNEIEYDKSISLDGLMAWRTLADAQADLERSKLDDLQPKRSSSGYLSSLFGKTSNKNALQNADDPPITLTVEEMKELEAISLEQTDEFDRSNDTWLLDVHFVLGALQIDLKNAKRPITTLRMGAVKSSFSAKDDGSLTFDFSLASLAVQDIITQNSIFPMVLRNLADAESKAFQMNFVKERNGDQQLRVSMLALELIASPILVLEVKKFFSFEDSETSIRIQQNPILRESLSGSVDLFFDADTGQESNDIEFDESIPMDSQQTAKLSDQLSNALAEAWKAKAKEKSSWTIDCDIQAPVLIVPESCSHYESSILVFDFGHVEIAYGSQRRATSEILDWADRQREEKSDSLDVGKISIDNLGFAVGKAKDILTSTGSISVKDHLHKTKSIIEPVSATLSCGILTMSQDASERLSFFGTFPSLCIRGSPQQMKDSLAVIHVWTKLSHKLGLDAEYQDSGILLLEESPTLLEYSDANSLESEVKSMPNTNALKLYIMLQLDRLSLYLDREQGDGLETHLISATASLSQTIDGSLQGRVCMGWFWILDMLKSSSIRQQRLIAHSTLPRSAEDISKSSNYDIFQLIEDTRSIPESDRTAGLADITYFDPGMVSNKKSSSFASEDPFNFEHHSGPCLKAVFDSLFVHWNPLAVISLTTALEEISGFSKLPIKAGTEVPNIHNMSTKQFGTIQKQKQESAPLLVRATMDKLEIMLNSARDDLPLYRFTMKHTAVSMLASQTDSRVEIQLGDLQVATPMSAANEEYHTIVGLNTKESSSLLSIQYYDGKTALSSQTVHDIDMEKLETYAHIVVSPVRCVFIQSQILTLVDYVNDGILGALAAQAASSAATVALEMASSGSQGNKLFVLKAVGFELVLPQSVTSDRCFLLRTGDLSVSYTALPDPGGGTALLSLRDLTLCDENAISLVAAPLYATIDAHISPSDIGTLEDQAIRVAVQISKAAFLLSKEHYAQLMLTLDENIGEENNYLRPNDASEIHLTPLTALEEENGEISFHSAPQSMTHAGVEFVLKRSRIYATLTLDAISLEAFKTGRSESLAFIEATKMIAGIDLLPDTEQLIMRVTLHNLTCQNSGQSGMNRKFKYLFDKSSTDLDEKEIFQVVYAKDKLKRLDAITIKIGSPRMFVIPDIVSDLIDFVSLPSPSSDSLQKMKKDIEIQVENQGNTVELIEIGETEILSVSLAASNCQLVFVDLGGSTCTNANSDVTAESIIIQGTLNMDYKTESEIITGTERKADFDFHGVDLEAYTAYGFSLSRPLQILDPVSLSLFYNLQNKDGQSPTIEIRAVTLTDVNTTISMQNIALMEVIVSGLMEFSINNKVGESEVQGLLSDDEVNRISALAAELDSNEDGFKSKSDVSFHVDNSMNASSTHSAKSVVTSTSPYFWIIRMTIPRILVTLVNDLQGLDEPLLRMDSSNVVVGAEYRTGMHLSKIEPLFDAHVHCSLNADYFDSSVNQWEELLVKPWEWTFKTTRGVSRRYRTNRLSTTLDVECFPCYISFSEQFLASLNGANRMWSTYSRAIEAAVDRNAHGSSQKRKALAASASRKMITSLPYAIENLTGVELHFSVDGTQSLKDRAACASGSINYFRFDPPRGSGSGGRRLYGQEVTSPKQLQLFIEQHEIVFHHIDDEFGKGRKIHRFDDGLVVITNLRKETKSMVLRIGSQIDLINSTAIPFSVSISCSDFNRDIGTCDKKLEKWRPLSVKGDSIIEKSRTLGIPIDSLRGFDKDSKIKPLFIISPHIPSQKGRESSQKGEILIPSSIELKALVESGTSELIIDIVCKEKSFGDADIKLLDPFVVLVRLRIMVVDMHPLVEIILEPRATLKNSLPVAVLVKTLMPHTFSNNEREDLQDQLGYERVHQLNPADFMEVFTPGPSFAIGLKFADLPISGGITDWMKNDWVELPMMREFRLLEPIRCDLPFKEIENCDVINTYTRIFVVENRDDLSEETFEQFGASKSFDQVPTLRPQSETRTLGSVDVTNEAMRSYLVTVCNYGVDHTGLLLFEQVHGFDSSNLRSSNILKFARSSLQQNAPPFGAFSFQQKDGARVSILSSSQEFIRILQMNIALDNGIRRSQMFRIDDVPICEGGLESLPVYWDDGSKSSFLMYRTLVDSFQSELHIVPEFIVYNSSSTHSVIVRQFGAEVFLEPKKMARIVAHPKLGLDFNLDYFQFSGQACRIRAGELKHQLVVVKTIEGLPLGSLAVQTVIGGRNSKLVVKLGDVKFGADARNLVPTRNTFGQDLIRVRIRWSELQITLCERKATELDSEANPLQIQFLEKIVDRMKSPLSNTVATVSKGHQGETKNPVCTICLTQFTADWQRIFKDEDVGGNLNKFVSAERSQLSLLIHSLKIMDKTPNTMYPVVLDSSSSKVSFFDLCIRTRGPLDADLMKVDLIDMNLAHSNNVSDKIILKTSEDFVWNMLDISNRIVEKATAISGDTIKLQWNENEEDFEVLVAEGLQFEMQDDTAPPSDFLIDIHRARVSPFSLIISFQRRPQKSRYTLVRHVRGAKLANYFLTRLKFTLDKAELKFARYEGHNIKGPPNRLIEIVTAVYVSRMKLKIMSILSATSFQDWKYLTDRNDGDDEFVDGDVLRATGNLVGKSANFIAKRVGQGLGVGVVTVTKKIGDGIENASDKVGARAVGAGVNSVVSGLGEGIGGTVIGVGTGAGKVLKGAGKGVGQMVGGVAGGFAIAGKGIGKGVMKGDGKAVLSGLSDGAVSMGQGVGQGVESAVMGAADGFLSVGHGIFSGAKSIGKGFGGAFKTPTKKTER